MAQSRPLWQTQPSLQQVANEIQLITEAASLLDSPSLPVTFAVRKKLHCQAVTINHCGDGNGEMMMMLMLMLLVRRRRRLEEEEEEAGNDQMSPPRLMPSWTCGELAWQRRTRPNFFAAVPKAVGWCGAESLVIGMDQDGISSWGCPLEHRSTQKVKELVRSSRDST